MSNPINNIPSAPGASSGTSGTASSGGLAGSSMSQADFLKLMTAQLQAQDPTNPMDNSQFVAQLAQFSQLSATQDLNTNLQSLSSNLGSSLQTTQVLSSSNLIDRNVLVPASHVAYAGSSMSGAVNLPADGTAAVTVKNAAGQVVRTIDLGSQAGGLASFTWDGLDDNGQTVPAGTYSVSASSGGNALDTYVAGKVSGVGYGGSSVGTYLQVAGVGGVPLSQVAQIL
ncbi:flagellar hook assembly protein FlgD [Frateuria defendens]|uniref:flagellar hook assembly protein FlgD n=1 Tax=Frateuria defendens TaxID=2219559 RepID=UPI0007DC3F6A|nr:flagellar hook capping FlgD N-terminal domain-containing protein [Frateuria defendens]